MLGRLLARILPPGTVANAWMYAAARERCPRLPPGPLSVDLRWEEYDRLGPRITP